MGKYRYDKPNKKWQTQLMQRSSRLFAHHFVAMAIIVVCLLGLLGFCTGVLNQSLNGVEGSIWEWSGFAIWFNAFSTHLLSGLLLVVFLLSLIFSRLFSVLLIAIPIASLVGWLGYTGLNMVQAINVHLDSKPYSTLCTQVIETVSLGCTKITHIKGPSGSRNYCPSLMTLKGDERVAPIIKVSGITPETDSVCFSLHSGFLGMPWINNVLPPLKTAH